MGNLHHITNRLKVLFVSDRLKSFVLSNLMVKLSKAHNHINYNTYNIYPRSGYYAIHFICGGLVIYNLIVRIGNFQENAALT